MNVNKTKYWFFEEIKHKDFEQDKDFEQETKIE